MTGQVDPYVRVYYRIVDDPKFATVFDDDAALALWLRLLLQADAMHPATATLPHGVKKPALAKLVAAGLVDVGTGYRYRIHGLTAEREQRSEHARIAARAKHEQPVSNPRAAGEQSSRAAISEPNQTEPNQTETRQQARASLVVPVKGMNGTTTDVPISAVQPPVDMVELQRLAEELTGTAYVMANVFSGYGSKAVEEQLIPHGFERVARAWRQISAQVTANGTSRPTLRQLVLGADDILNPIPSSKEINAVDKAAEEERRRKRREEVSQKQLAYLREGENR